MPVHAQGAQDSVLLAPDRAAATATRAATVDTRGFAYASIRVNLSSGANTNAVAAALDLQESDDTVVTNFATITAQTSKAVTAANSHTFHVDMRGRKRYLRLLLTPATATTDLISVGAVANLSRAGEWPSSTTEMNSQGATII